MESLISSLRKLSSVKIQHFGIPIAIEGFTKRVTTVLTGKDDILEQDSSDGGPKW